MTVGGVGEATGAAAAHAEAISSVFWAESSFVELASYVAKDSGDLIASSSARGASAADGSLAGSSPITARPMIRAQRLPDFGVGASAMPCSLRKRKQSFHLR